MIGWCWVGGRKGRRARLRLCAWAGIGFLDSGLGRSHWASGGAAARVCLRYCRLAADQCSLRCKRALGAPLPRVQLLDLFKGVRGARPGAAAYHSANSSLNAAISRCIGYPPTHSPLTPTQLLDLFKEVWGAGEDTANRWIDGGCRSLGDVAARADLTPQQRVGAGTGGRAGGQRANGRRAGKGGWLISQGRVGGRCRLSTGGQWQGYWAECGGGQAAHLYSLHPCMHMLCRPPPACSSE